jgi:hypothetical protein
MKNFFRLFVLLSLTVVYANAQTNAESFLNKMPGLPKDSCNITKTEVESLTQKVSALIDQTENEIDVLNEKANEKGHGNEEAAKEAAMQQMSQQYGLSQDEMNKMKSGKMSAAEKQAMANKVLQQQTNMSMGEVQNLSKMSDAGKKAYAEAYATEAQATAQANPNKQPVNQSSMNMQQLISAQQAVLGKINANGQKIGNLYASIQNDPDLSKMKKNIKDWQSKIMSMTGVDYGQGKQMDSLAVLIKKEQTKICDKYTPKYRSALRQHLSIMKSSMADIQQLGEITGELTKAQTGIVPPAESTEIRKLQAIKEYLTNLKDAYQFKLCFPEEN